MKQLCHGALALLLLGCGSDDTTSADTASADPLIQAASTQAKDISNDEIYARLINDERFPVGFYEEPQNNSDFFIRIQHISNHDVADFTVNFRYTLCAKNHHNAINKANRTIISKNASLQAKDIHHEYYYEFSWLSSSNMLNKQRIYRCDIYKIDTDNNYQRTYQVAVFDASAFQRFIEYQWYFSFNNNYGNVVIESTIEDTEVGLTQVKITSAHLTSFTDCDEISIRENYYNIDDISRKISQSEEIREVFYKPRDAAALLC